MTKFGMPNIEIELPTTPATPFVQTSSSNNKHHEQTPDFDEDDGYQAYTDSESEDESSDDDSATDNEEGVHENAAQSNNRPSQFQGILYFSL
jgi:hypothetical protein